VRARLYRAIDTQEGDPNPDSTIDVTAALPIVSDGVTAATLFLHTDDVANPVGSLTSPATLMSGAVEQGHAGSWAGAQPQDCSADAPPNEVCVPGGAYWMGNPDIIYGDAAEANRERLVVLSPFFMTAHEVTVKEFRVQNVDVSAVLPWTGSRTGSSFGDWCTFTPNTSANDSLPVNCLDWATARAYCRASGADLPSEAQYEYVLGALQSTLYVWGGDEPTCAYARYALAGFGMSLGYGPSDCRSSLTDFGGVVAANPSSPDRDKLTLSGGTIVDLEGNLEEWVLDKWDPQDGPCWGTGVFTNPTCDDAKATSGATRGAGWLDPAVFLHAAYRSGATSRSAKWIGVGFRCARPG
jgi:formylglycine-generating enzyme required for sulfatase activity